jgi:23S rRNA (guanosine2251-2'-O)-methyltransferase
MSQDAFIYGIHTVRVLLRREPGRIKELWIDAGRRDRRVGELNELAAAQGLRVQGGDAQTLERLVGDVPHQGVAARCIASRVLGEPDLSALLEASPEPALLLVLDGVTDPHNLGACLRTADAAGVLAVVAPRDRAVGLTPTVRKVACGAAETTPFVQVTNLARTLAALKEGGVWVAGTDDAAEQGLHDADLSGPLALVMGAEGKGLRRLTRERCDFLLRIPMRGAVESLNVSVATGICLYEALRQRGLG